jgi:hypothetical protein
MPIRLTPSKRSSSFRSATTRAMIWPTVRHVLRSSRAAAVEDISTAHQAASCSKASVWRAVASPRNCGHEDAVPGTRDSRDARDDEHLGASEVEGPPTSLAARVIAGAAILAMWAAPAVLDPGSQMNLEIVADELDALDWNALGIDTKGPG